MDEPEPGVMHRVVTTTILLALTVLAGCAETDVPETVDDAASNVAAPLPDNAAIVHGTNVTAALNATSVPVGAFAHTGFSSFEPTIGVTSSGALFMSNSEGAIATGHSSIVRSTDRGATWQDITPKLGPISTPPTSFDPYVHVDQDTDRIYNLDMEGLNCNYIQWSDDDGESFTGHPLGCGQPPVLDHPSLFTGAPRVAPTVGYDNVVYLCVNRVADAACATSFDGGITFTPFRPVFPDPVPGEGGASGSCGGLSGHGTTGPEGRAYLGRIHCGVPAVAVTEDDGLTWQTSIISEDHPSIRHDVELAVDAAGNVYALWVGPDDDLFLSVSADHAATWSEPIEVAAPGVETVVFPAIAAGDAGRIAFVYLGTDSDVAIPDMPNNVTWTAYLATMRGADGPDPLIASALLNNATDPVARGPCDDDNRCGGIGDFIDIVIDDEGRPWAGLVDVCHDACDASSGNDRAEGMVGTLRQGFPLRGDADALPVLDSLASP